MVNTLIPNIDQLQQQLEAIAEICEADEVRASTSLVPEVER